MDAKQFIETWEIHNRINLYLLKAIKEEYLTDISASKGRNVGEQFAHKHNVRLMWLKAADPGLLKGQNKIEMDTTISKKLLTVELTKSAKAISTLLEKGFEEGKVKGFKPHPAAFFGYLISHGDSYSSYQRYAIFIFGISSATVVETGKRTPG